MTPPEPLEILRVRGTHREAGEQAGGYWADHIRDAVAFDGVLPAGMTHGSTDRHITFGRGNPCDSQAQEYAFPA